MITGFINNWEIDICAGTRSRLLAAYIEGNVLSDFSVIRSLGQKGQKQVKGREGPDLSLPLPIDTCFMIGKYAEFARVVKKNRPHELCGHIAYASPAFYATSNGFFEACRAGIAMQFGGHMWSYAHHMLGWDPSNKTSHGAAKNYSIIGLDHRRRKRSRGGETNQPYRPLI